MAKRSAPASPSTFSPNTRIVLLFGPEALLRHQHTAELAAMLEKEHGEVDILRFSGLDADAATVLDECRSFGLIAAHKLVILDEADALIKEATRKLFESYADAPSPGATLVLRSASWRPGNLDKQIAKVGAVIKCEEVKEPEAIAWVIRRAKETHGVPIDRDAAEELVGRSGAALAQLDIELAKLATAAIAAGSRTITKDLIEQFVVLTREIKPWSVSEYLLSGSAEQAIRSIRNTIETSPRGAEIPLLFACSSTVQALHAAAIAHRLRMPLNVFATRILAKGTWAIQRPYQSASRLDPRRTASLLASCVEADTHSKSGVGRPDRLLEMLAVRCSEVLSTR